MYGKTSWSKPTLTWFYSYVDKSSGKSIYLVASSSLHPSDITSPANPGKGHCLLVCGWYRDINITTNNKCMTLLYRTSNHPIKFCQGPVGTTGTDCPWPALLRLHPTMPTVQGPIATTLGPSVPSPVMVEQGWSAAPSLPASHPAPGWSPWFCPGLRTSLAMLGSVNGPHYQPPETVPYGWGHSQCWATLRSGSITPREPPAHAAPSRNCAIYNGDLIYAFPEVILQIRKHTCVTKQLHQGLHYSVYSVEKSFLGNWAIFFFFFFKVLFSIHWETGNDTLWRLNMFTNGFASVLRLNSGRDRWIFLFRMLRK